MIQPTHIALVIGILACVTDWHSRRIPNELTFSAAFLAIACQGLIAGPDGARAAAIGWLVGVALFFPFFALGGLGAGDVKLLGAIGAWLGAATVMQVALYSAMAGGVLAVVVALRSGYLRTALRNIGFLLKYWSATGFKPAEGLTLGDEQTPKLAYAIPVLTGLVVTLWLH